MARPTPPARIGNRKTLRQAAPVKIRPRQLPLHCPMPNSSLWDSHPRVFLPLADAPDGQIRCPYCGTLYVLDNRP